MRGAVVGLGLLAACSPPPPAPVTVPPPPASHAPVDAAAVVAVAPRDAGPPPPPTCVRAPCLVGKDAASTAVVGTDLYFLRHHGERKNQRSALMRRGRDDASPIEIVPNIRPPSGAYVVQMKIDATGAVILLRDSLAIVDFATKAVRFTGLRDLEVREIALDGAVVYLLDEDCTVKTVARSGGAITVLGKTSPDTCFGAVMALDDTDVFVSAGPAIYAVPRAGGKGRLVTTFERESFVPGIVPHGPSLIALAVPPEGRPRISRVPKKGGRPVELAKCDADTRVNLFMGDAARLYWLEPRGDEAGAVMTMPIDGSTPPTVFAKSNAYTFDLMLGPDDVYWMSGDQYELRRMHKTK